MEKRVIQAGGQNIVVFSGSELLLTDAQSALDLVATINYMDDSSRLVIPKQAVTEDFFILSSGLAGDILQKFVNYHFKLAIYGDFSHYTSKPLRDFIYECNQGHDIFFAADEAEAIERLSLA